MKRSILRLNPRGHCPKCGWLSDPLRGGFRIIEGRPERVPDDPITGTCPSCGYDIDDFDRRRLSEYGVQRQKQKLIEVRESEWNWQKSDGRVFVVCYGPSLYFVRPDNRYAVYASLLSEKDALTMFDPYARAKSSWPTISLMHSFFMLGFSGTNFVTRELALPKTPSEIVSDLYMSYTHYLPQLSRIRNVYWAGYEDRDVYNRDNPENDNVKGKTACLSDRVPPHTSGRRFWLIPGGRSIKQATPDVVERIEKEMDNWNVATRSSSTVPDWKFEDLWSGYTSNGFVKADY